MLLTQTHDEERYWLTRRLGYLDRVGSLLDRDADIEEFECLFTEFSKVETPKDVIDRLRDIYGYVE